MFLIILLDVKLATIVSIFVYTYYFQKSINISQIMLHFYALF